ncbi:MAG: hypothetical protein ACUVUC_14515 [Thermoguttaceae bacterium]
MLTGREAFIPAGDGIHGTIGGLSGLTSVPGHYVLTLSNSSAGVFDEAGNPLATNAVDH